MVYLTSDTHFYHGNIIKNGNRPFQSVEEMNDVLVENWNKVVKKDDDIVYHLGDFALWKPFHQDIAKQLRGRKRLILGNHDQHHPSVYTNAGFEQVLSSYEHKTGMIFSHIPVHPHQFNRWKANIHGHLHQNMVMHNVAINDEIETWQPDPRYLNACVENWDYRPFLLDEAIEVLKQRGIAERV